MSIKLGQPSLILNADDPFLGGMSMWTTWDCPKDTRPKDVVYWILYACAHSPDRLLRHVILNFHGLPGQVYLSGDPVDCPSRDRCTLPKAHTIDCNNVGIFGELRKKNIGTIWLHSCLVAEGFKGKYFCRQMAMAAGCDVIAAEEEQEEWWPIVNKVFMGYGCIDDYEGPVYRFSRNANYERFYPNGRTFESYVGPDVKKSPSDSPFR